MRLFKPNVRKMLRMKDVHSLIKVLDDPYVNIRSAAARALGEIGNTKAVEPLVSILRKDNSLSVRLTCFVALEKILGNNISESDVQDLVDTVATRIRQLYSRTRITEPEKVEWEIFGSSSTGDVYDTVVIPTRTEPDPDIKSIRKLISLIPWSLRERVRMISGEAKDIHELW